MIAVKKCHIILLFAYVSLFSLGLDFLCPYRQIKVVAWLRFRKLYVLKASFRKTLLQITDINLKSSNYKLAQWILRRTFHSAKVSLGDFETEIPSVYRPLRL